MKLERMNPFQKRPNLIRVEVLRASLLVAE